MTIDSVKSVQSNAVSTKNKTSVTPQPEVKTEDKKNGRILLLTGLAALGAVGIYIATKGKKVASHSTNEMQNSAINFWEALDNACDKLTQKSKTAGKTIKESVENFFGKDSKIKPHTYDVAKEGRYIVTMQHNRGHGFQTVNVSSKNMIARNIKDFPIGYEDFSNHNVIPGIKDGRPFVRAEYPGLEKDSMGNGILNAIILLSPDSKLTKAQKDLLSIIGKDGKGLSGEVLEAFQNLTLQGVRTPVQFDGSGTNYDAILSVIQTFAQRVGK